MANIVGNFVRHVLPQILKPIRALWNEVIGFVFLSLAAVPVPRTIRHWQEYSETGQGLSRIVLSGIFITMMAAFGIHSFLRARKISRS
ncbi:MAG: hypothetical protein ACE141_05500 [Bryobacteraceae bacterium]